MSNVPKARMRLRIIARRLDSEAKKIKKICDELLIREVPITRAPQQHKKVTERVRRRVVDLHKIYPKWSQQRIAQEVGTNIGRVSEILKEHYRKPE